MKLHPTLGEISDELAAALAAEGDTSAADAPPPAAPEPVTEPLFPDDSGDVVEEPIVPPTAEIEGAEA